MGVAKPKRPTMQLPKRIRTWTGKQPDMDKIEIQMRSGM